MVFSAHLHQGIPLAEHPRYIYFALRTQQRGSRPNLMRQLSSPTQPTGRLFRANHEAFQRHINDILQSGAHGMFEKTPAA